MNFRLKKTVKEALIRINFYNSLSNQVESLRKTSFSYQNKLHCELILDLWNALKSDERLESDNKLITKQWIDIGFQSSDPSTDFRGMGMLGLTNLV